MKWFPVFALLLSGQAFAANNAFDIVDEKAWDAEIRRLLYVEDMQNLNADTTRQFDRIWHPEPKFGPVDRIETDIMSPMPPKK